MNIQGFYTEKGLALAAKLAAGTKLTVTKAVAGSGSTAASAQALADIKQTLTVGSAKVEGQTATLPVTLAESGASASYTLAELGVYATDPDEGEILFQVFRLSEGHAITAGGESVYRFYLRVTVGASGVTVTCSPSGLLVEEDLTPVYAAIAKKPNAMMSGMEIHVAKTGSDSTGDGSKTKPFLTIQKAVNSLPKLLLDRPVIYIHAGTYEENVDIQGFIGINDMYLIGVSGETVKVNTIHLRKCLMFGPVGLENLELIGTSGDGYNWSLQCEGVTYVSLNQIKSTHAVPSSNWGALRFDGVLSARLINTTVSNKNVALDVIASTVYLNSTVTGSGNTVGIRCGSAWGNAGGYVQKGGTTLSGEEQKGFGGQIW